jgi:hypothetical protein
MYQLPLHRWGTLEKPFCLLAVFLRVVAQELGLDELRNAATMRPTPRPMPQPDTSTSTSSSTDAAEASTSGSSGSNPSLRAISEDMAKQLDPEIELKRAMSEQAAWGGQAPAAAAAAAPAAAGEGKAAADSKQGKVSNGPLAGCQCGVFEHIREILAIPLLHDISGACVDALSGAVHIASPHLLYFNPLVYLHAGAC